MLLFQKGKWYAFQHLDTRSCHRCGHRRLGRPGTRTQESKIELIYMLWFGQQCTSTSKKRYGILSPACATVHFHPAVHNVGLPIIDCTWVSAWLEGWKWSSVSEWRCEIVAYIERSQTPLSKQSFLTKIFMQGELNFFEFNRCSRRAKEGEGSGRKEVVREP